MRLQSREPAAPPADVWRYGFTVTSRLDYRQQYSHLVSFTMALPVGRTNFKKKEGILTLTSDYQTVTWTPNTGGPPTVSLTVPNITSKSHVPSLCNMFRTKPCHRSPANAG